MKFGNFWLLFFSTFQFMELINMASEKHTRYITIESENYYHFKRSIKDRKNWLQLTKSYNNVKHAFRKT